MKTPALRSTCWRGARSDGCRNIFRVEQFDVNVEQRYNSHGQRVTVAMAVVKVDGRRRNADFGGGRQRPGQCA